MSLQRLLVTSLFVVTTATTTSSSGHQSACALINSAFEQETDKNEAQACHCYMDTPTSKNLKLDQLEHVWIGCTRQKMPQVFSALNVLNETIVSKLRIWDSLINIIPADMFAQVRPRVLSIDNSGLSLFRPGAFSNIGHRLRVLRLRNNIIKRIEPIIFKDIERVETLDLGGNKLSALKMGELDRLNNLKTLILSDNQIASLEDGVFAKLSTLKLLNLANNKLTNISRNTFMGLSNLEFLDLQSNNILFIDWSAFENMKNLKYLNLGNNHISLVHINGLKSLEKLYINNNSIQSLKNIVIRDLPNLDILNLDRNAITEIRDGDLNSLEESSRLTTLSIVANKILKVDARAFEPLHQLTTLSLQYNQIESLLATDGTVNVSFLRPLRKLIRLYLSNNNLARIDQEDLMALNALKVIALDHNEIEEIHSEALSGLPITRLYLNRNRLFYLPKSLIDDLSTKSVEVVDLSDNHWQCVCGDQRLSDWLTDIGDRSVADGSMGCVTSHACIGRSVDETGGERSVWITVVASILAAISLLILVIIAFLYVEEGRRTGKVTSPLRRVPSDLLQLIPNGSTMSLPFETGLDSLLTMPQKQAPLISHANIRNPGLVVQRPSNTESNSVGQMAEKKRVRFDDDLS